MKPYHSVDVLVFDLSLHFHLPDHSAIASLHSFTSWISWNSFSYLIRYLGDQAIDGISERFLA